MLFRLFIIISSVAISFGLYVESSYALNHAAKQIGARNRVWPRGIMGDPKTSIAVFDTGVDARHRGFGNGFLQDGDWAQKIIFWYDEFGGKTGIPNDKYTPLGSGHGTHVSGIASSSGFANFDQEGRIVNTNAYQTNLSGEYPEQTAMYVNKTGTIRIEFAFEAEAGNIRQLFLKFGNGEQFYEDVAASGRKVRGNLTTVASMAGLRGTSKLHTLGASDQAKINWNVVEYRVNDSSQFGMYHVITDRDIPQTSGLSKAMYFQYVSHWPVGLDTQQLDPNDHRPYYIGIAPQAKLFEVQATSAYPFMDSLDHIMNELEDYHVIVVNVSAASSSFKESYFDDLSMRGIVTVAAVGNEGPTVPISIPARFKNVVAVGGLTPADTIPWYNNTGNKLDILTPGGSNLTGGGIISVHSGDGNFLNAWGFDVVPNDGLGMQGSSMATASAAGAFALVYQALGGWDGFVSNDQFSLGGHLLSREEKAKLVKQIIFMTATELNTKREIYKKNPSESASSSAGPILNRGYDINQDPAAQNYGKDPFEGYGRINVDAAVDAVLLEIKPGEEISQLLVSSAATWTSTTLNDDGIFQGSYVLEKAEMPKALARHFIIKNLEPSKTVHFKLEVPTKADFDLYIYQPAPGPNGEPLLLAKSTTAQTGANESVSINPGVLGKYYVVAKAVSGEGLARLLFTQ